MMQILFIVSIVMMFSNLILVVTNDPTFCF